MSLENQGLNWSEADESLLMIMVKRGSSLEDLEATFKRSKKACRTRAKKLRIRSHFEGHCIEKWLKNNLIKTTSK